MDDNIFECQPHLNISGHLYDMNLTEGWVKLTSFQLSVNLKSWS